MGVWLAGVFWDRYGATSISTQVERTDSTPNGWEVGVTVGMAGGERSSGCAEGQGGGGGGREGGGGGELDRSWGGLGWEGVGLEDRGRG